MAKEIERKFLVREEDWKPVGAGIPIRQGYLPSSSRTVLRVRVMGELGFIAIKGETTGATRTEFEYRVPRDDATQILDELCEHPCIEKTRYRQECSGLNWDIDVFEAENAGLILAEVELRSEDQEIDMPPWIDTEVTGDPRYYNVNLVHDPFTRWGDN